MKPFPRTITFPFFCCLFSFVLSSAGCINLDKKAPDIQAYAMDLPQQNHSAYDGPQASLRLNTFSAVPAFSDRYLTYRTGETVYEQDFYNQLMAAPARMVQDQFFIWLKASPMVSFVLPADSVEKADFVIEGKLLNLSGDYRNTEEPKAVFKIQFTVSREESGNPQVLFQKVYSSEIPIKHPSPRPLTEGWITGVGQVLAAFEADLKNLVIKLSQA